MMWLHMVSDGDEDAPRSADVEHDQHGCDDVVHQGFAGRLDSVGPGGDDEVPDDDEEAAGEEAKEEFETPIEVGRVGIGDTSGLRICCGRCVGWSWSGDRSACCAED